MNITNKIAVAAILVCTLFGCTSTRLDVKEKQQDSELTLQEITRIESGLQMPRGAFGLPLYERYYAFDEIDGKRMIVGLFLRSEKPQIRIVNHDSLPIKTDGGCSVVHFRYSIEEKRVIAIMCGGIA